MKRKTIFIFLVFLTRQLFADTTMIPEVNFNSQKNSGKTQEDSVQTTHIDHKKIQQTAVRSISELLKQQQSIVHVNSNSMDNSQTVLSIRGFGDNAVANTLILVDGFPLMNASLFAPNFNSIPLSDIENIKIIQGSQGTLYGNQAVGGVVNIVTRHPEDILQDAQIGYGSYNSQFYNALVGVKDSNGFFLKVFGLYNTSDNYRFHNNQNNGSAAAQFGWDYSRGTLSFNIQTYDETIAFPGGLTLAQFNTNPRQASDFKNSSRAHTHLYQLLNKQEINEDWILETHLDHHAITGDGIIFSHYTRNDEVNIINPLLKGNIDNNQILVGYDGVQTDYKLLNQLVNSKSNSMENDIYGQAEIPLWEKFKLILGGRNADQSNTAYQKIGNPATDSVDHDFVTEQGINFSLNKNWQFFLRRDGNFRFPKANELTWLQPGVTFLSPQTGVSYESGIEWDTNRQKTQLSVYYLQLHDEIAFDPTETPLNPFGAITNLPPTLRKGVTLTEQFLLNDEITLAGQINYVDARFNSGIHNGNIIPAVPAWTDNVDIDYQFAPHWRTEYTAVYTGSRFPSDDINNSAKLSGYWLNNISLQYFLKHFSASFAVNNIFNQRYPLYASFDLDSQSTVYYPAAGRNFLLTLKAFL